MTHISNHRPYPDKRLSLHVPIICDLRSRQVLLKMCIQSDVKFIVPVSSLSRITLQAMVRVWCTSSIPTKSQHAVSRPKSSENRQQNF